MKKTILCLLALFLVLLAGTALGEISTNLRKDIVYNAAGKVERETYLDSNGNPVVADDKGYATMRYFYNKGNQLIQVELQDAFGVPITGKDGYATIKYTYSLKKLTETAYYDAQGNPGTGPEGFSKEVTEWALNRFHLSTWRYDKAGNPVGLHRITEYTSIGKASYKVVSDTWFNAAGEMATGPDGYARVQYEYSGQNTAKISYLNADATPYYYKKVGYATMISDWKNGQLKSERYLGRENELIAGPKGYAQVVYTHTGNEWRLEMYYNSDGSLYFTKNGICGLQRKLGPRNRVIEEQYFIGEGVRGDCTAGYSRVTRSYSKKGKVLIERYYDARDRKTIPDSLGYHEVRYTYFRGSYTQQAAYYDTEGNLMRCNKGYAVMDYTLTQEGKVTQVVYLDRDGRTPVNSDKGYARIIYGLNQDGRTVVERYFDANGNPYVAEKNADEIRYEWNGANKTSESYWQDGMPVNGPDLYHEVQYTYNAGNKVIRTIYFNREGKLTNCAKGYAAIENEYNTSGVVMATKYYDAQGQLMLTPGKEYAFVRTIQTKDLRLVGSDAVIEEEEEETTESDEDDELPEGSDPWARGSLIEEATGSDEPTWMSSDAGIGEEGEEGEEKAPDGAIVEYHGTDGKLMMLAAGYAYLVRTNNDQGLVATEAYFDTEGNPVTLKAGYAKLEREYDINLLLSKESYFDAEGNKVLRTEGYHYYKRINDQKGNPMILTFWGLNDEPVMSTAGYHRIERIWLDSKHATEEAWFDTENNPQVAKNNTYVAIKRQFDANGNTVDEIYLDPDGNPIACKDGYDEIYRVFNEKNKATRTEYRLDGALVLNKSGYAVVCQTYDDKGLVASEWYLGINEEPVMCNKGYQWIDRTWMDSKHATSEAWYDADWNPVAPSDLYVRVERTFDERGNKTDERYYGPDGNLTLCKAGYDEVRTTFDDNSRAIRIEYLQQGWYVNLKDGYAVIERTYDSQGLVASESYYGADGKPAKHSKGYHRIDRTWLDSKHATSEAWFDTEGNPVTTGNTYVKITREFDDKGNTVVEQYRDPEDKLIACKAGYDEIRREFNEKNQASVIRYYLAGEPFVLKEGYFEMHRAYDEAGNVASESYFGADGAPVMHTSGYHRIDRTWQDSKHATSEAWFDTEGNPKNLKDTYCKIIRAFDERGNAFDIMYFGIDGEPIACKAGYDEERSAFDDKNRRISVECYLDGKRTLNVNNVSRIDMEYDEKGNVNHEIYFGTGNEPVLNKAGYREVRKVFDDKKRVTFEAWFNLDGSPMVKSKETYCAQGTEYDENGNAAVLKYYDGDGNPTSCANGYEMIWRRFNDRKKVVYETYHDHTGAPMEKKNGVYQTTYDYDEKDRVIQEQYFDADGQPTLCKAGYCRVVRTYNEQGKVIEEVYLNTNNEYALRDGKYCRIVRTYNADGKVETERFLLPDGSEVPKEG